MLQSTERGVGGLWSNTIVKEFLQEEIRVRLSSRNLYNHTSAQQVSLLFGRKIPTIPNDGTCRVATWMHTQIPPNLRSDAPREDIARFGRLATFFVLSRVRRHMLFIPLIFIQNTLK